MVEEVDQSSEVHTGTREQTIQMGPIIVKTNPESGYITFSCASCESHLKTYIGLENIVFADKVARTHSC